MMIPRSKSKSKSFLVFFIGAVWYFLVSNITSWTVFLSSLPLAVAAVAEAEEASGAIDDDTAGTGAAPSGGGGVLATKFGISDPTLIRSKENENKFRLDYQVSDFINQEKATFRIHTNRDCKGEFDKSLSALNVQFLTPPFESVDHHIGDGTIPRILSLGLEFNSVEYQKRLLLNDNEKQKVEEEKSSNNIGSTSSFSYYWSKVSSYLSGGAKTDSDDDEEDGSDKFKVCIRFMVHNLPTTNDESIEVNFKETFVVMDFGSSSGSSDNDDDGEEDKEKSSLLTISDIHLIPVDPVEVEVHIAGGGKVMVQVPIEKDSEHNQLTDDDNDSHHDAAKVAANDNDSESESKPKLKKQDLRQDLIQQKLKEMLDKDKLLKQQKQKEEQKPKEEL